MSSLPMSSLSSSSSSSSSVSSPSSPSPLSSAAIVSIVPPDVLSRVLEYLILRDRIRFLSSCRYLQSSRLDLERKFRRLVVSVPRGRNQGHDWKRGRGRGPGRRERDVNGSGGGRCNKSRSKVTSSTATTTGLHSGVGGTSANVVVEDEDGGGGGGGGGALDANEGESGSDNDDRALAATASTVEAAAEATEAETASASLSFGTATTLGRSHLLSSSSSSSSVLSFLARCRHLESAVPYFETFENLCDLDLGTIATDHFLLGLSGGAGAGAGANASADADANGSSINNCKRVELLKNLRRIRMVGSMGITNRGLDHISRGNHRAANLRCVDITFCRRTTYAGTFVLRDRLRNLELLRRQPSWLDGSFVTPFKGATGGDQNDDDNDDDDGNGDNEGMGGGGGGGGDEGMRSRRRGRGRGESGDDRDRTYADDDDDNNVEEVHVYWADGTFSFNRGVQSEGFVSDLFPLVGDNNNNNNVSSSYNIENSRDYGLDTDSDNNDVAETEATDHYGNEIRDSHHCSDEYDYDYDRDFYGDEHGPCRLGDRLQYTNFEPPPSWPAWARYCYRPGVSLLRLPTEEEAVSLRSPSPTSSSHSHKAGTKKRRASASSGSDGAGASHQRQLQQKQQQQQQQQRAILVAQHLAGLRAPRDSPDAHRHDIDSVPLGESRAFDRDGRPLDSVVLEGEEGVSDDDVDIDVEDGDTIGNGNGDGGNRARRLRRRRRRHRRSTIQDAARHPQSYTLVSRMKVLPLPDDGKFMPPRDVVERNRAFCIEMERAATDPGGTLKFFHEQASIVRRSSLPFRSPGMGWLSPAGTVDPLTAALDFGENILHSALLHRAS